METPGAYSRGPAASLNRGASSFCSPARARRLSAAHVAPARGSVAGRAARAVGAGCHGGFPLMAAAGAPPPELQARAGAKPQRINARVALRIQLSGDRRMLDRDRARGLDLALRPRPAL